MKISIFFQHVLRAAEEMEISVEEVLLQLKEEGLSGVECSLLHADDAAVKLFGKTGLPVSSVYEYVPIFTGEFQAGITLVDRAKEIGTKTVMIVPGAFPEKMEKRKALEESVIPLTKIAEYGAKRGIVVTVEDYDNTHTLFDNASDMLFMGDRIKDLYFTFDSGNFYSAQEPMEAFCAIKKKIRHVHLKDLSDKEIPGHTRVRQTRYGKTVYDVPFGRGVLPGKEILIALKEIQYNGFLCLEHNADSGEMMQANLAAIRWLKQNI